jgi:hypothetical protein
MKAEASTEAFKTYIPREIHAKLEIVEVDIRLDCNLVPDEEVDAELCQWILDTCSSHSRDMKYNRTIDLYWHMKTLLIKMLAERNIAHSEILMQMEYLQLKIKVVDHKITLLAEKAVGLDLNASCKENQQVPMEESNSPPT